MIGFTVLILVSYELIWWFLFSVIPGKWLILGFSYVIIKCKDCRCISAKNKSQISVKEINDESQTARLYVN